MRMYSYVFLCYKHGEGNLSANRQVLQTFPSPWGTSGLEGESEMGAGQGKGGGPAEVMGGQE